MRLPRVRFTVRRMMVAVAVVGSFIGWEVREVARVRGSWQVVRSRPVMPWQATREAADTPEAKIYTSVRVRRWSFYGLGRGRTSMISREDGKLHPTDVSLKARR